MEYLLTEGLFWGIGCFYISCISLVKKAKLVLVLRKHIVWRSRALLLYTCIWIYRWYKENLQQASFCKSVLRRSINPFLALLSSSLLLRPSISLSLETAVEVRSPVCHRCGLLLLLLFLLFMFQPLPRPSTDFLYTFYAYSFFFSLFSKKKKKNQPFLFPCSFCVARQPCNCGTCEERDETGPCVGRHRASVPTYSLSPSRVFVPSPLWSAS